MREWYLDGVLISSDYLQAPSVDSGSGGHPQHGEPQALHPHWPGHRMAPEATPEPSATHGFFPGHRRAVERAERAGAERISRAGPGRPPVGGRGDTDKAIRDAAAANGIDVNTMRAIASIESDMNPQSNRNARTQYKGLYQIGRDEWAKWGRGDIYDPHDNAAAAGRMLAAHKAEFKQRFGRDPSDAELYMIHQQGMGFHTRGTMTNIAGNKYPGMRGPQTKESFQRGWGAELERRKQHFERGTAAAPAPTTAPAVAPGAVTAAGGAAPQAFIVHHTGGRGDVAGVQNTLRARGLGVQYVMDREGNITQTGGPGSSHMRTGWGAGAGLSNRNTVGMEVIAKDDKDVTPAQVAAAKRFLAERYPNTPVFGHGEVNPGHKEADEGMTIVNAVRNERAANAARAATHRAAASSLPDPSSTEED